MKKTVFGCGGHAFIGNFLYTDKNGMFHEFTLPGGAALVQQLLSGKGLTKHKPLSRSYRHERFGLKQFEDKQTQKSYFAVSRYLGFTEGETTLLAGKADYAIVCDEGFGAIRLPADNVPILWASAGNLPTKEVIDPIAARCFLLLDANVLRNSGAMISSRISWERSVTELLWQLQHNPALSYLCKASHILITFAEDGAVYLRQEDGKPKASLVLAHGNGEGFLRKKINGSISDTFSLMTATLALQLPDVMERKKPLRILPVLKAAESRLTQGYSLEMLAKGKAALPETGAIPDEIPFDVPFDPEQSVVDPDFWCISNNASNRRIFDMACDYVLKGAKVIEGLPLLSFGALTTIDRLEIEAYRNICNLIENYVDSDSIRPLSIAVFGAPGSGKSFGVTQIAKNILPDKVEKLEFNVSQFANNADLSVAFQKVRDVTLEGKLPLVFFDEFDSDRNGLQLGWVKNFLMPMQDGKFKDESGEHPLGKCILVFAGGTSSSFEEFSHPMSTENSETQKRFKDVKGPDFVSRLRGTINVLGPNPTHANDKNYILRRALLLRSLCIRKLNVNKNGDAPLNKNVLWAMLLVPKYKHGARSMEAILDMSRIEGNVWEPVSLPFYSQLSLHVDADAFIRLVLREVILNSYTEKLAIAIHEDFCIKNPTSDNNKPWTELREDLKESNRDQARCFALYLKEVNCDFDSGDTPFQSIEKFSNEAILKIAKLSHEIWMKSKTDAGWILGKKKDAVKKTHPLIVAWSKLPQAEKQKDKDIAENIIPLLKGIGLRVYQVE